MLSYTVPLARLFLSLIFIMAGVNKIGSFTGSVGYMQSHGMPLAEILLVGAIVVELGGGVLILAGYKTSWGALALAAFMVPTTLIFHAFWAVPPEQASVQQLMFMKNLAITGGLLALSTAGSGKLSVDGLFNR